jgi:hypothetical protein
MRHSWFENAWWRVLLQEAASRVAGGRFLRWPWIGEDSLPGTRTRALLLFFFPRAVFRAVNRALLVVVVVLYTVVAFGCGDDNSDGAGATGGFDASTGIDTGGTGGSGGTGGEGGIDGGGVGSGGVHSGTGDAEVARMDAAKDAGDAAADIQPGPCRVEDAFLYGHECIDLEYEYDDRGRTTRIQGTYSLEETYEYEDDPDGGVTIRHRRSWGPVTEIDTLEALDAEGKRLRFEDYRAGIVEIYAWDGARLDHVDVENLDGAPLAVIEYTYDDQGRPLLVRETRGMGASAVVLDQTHEYSGALETVRRQLNTSGEVAITYHLRGAALKQNSTSCDWNSVDAGTLVPIPVDPLVSWYVFENYDLGSSVVEVERFVYDDHDRVVGRDLVRDGCLREQETFAYDQSGFLTRRTDLHPAHYDPAHYDDEPPCCWNDAYTESETYIYDSLGRRSGGEWDNDDGGYCTYVPHYDCY